MLHIFLLIIKVIGIILAVVLGVLLLVVLAVLFCPVHYRMKGSHKDEWNVEARAHFLGPVVMFRIWYREEVCYKLRILGIPIMRNDKTEKSSRNSKNSNPKKSRQKEKQTNEEDDASSVSGQLGHEEESKEKDLTSQSGQLGADKSDVAMMEEEKASFTEKIGQAWISFKERIINFWDILRNILQTIKEGFSNAVAFKDSFVEFYEDEGVQSGFSKIKKEVWHLLKKIKPRKFRWYLKFGFEDPGTTGQVLGAIAVLSGMWGKEIQAEPDFEHKVFETDFDVRGIIQGFRLVRLIMKFLFDKDIQYFLKQGKGLRS